MKAEIVVGIAMAISGIVAAFCGSPTHLIIATLPGAALTTAAYAEQRRDRKRSAKYTNHNHLTNKTTQP